MLNYVFTAFNEKYKIMGATLISSIWENNPDDITICVLDLGLKLKTKSKLSNWAVSKKRNIIFYTVNFNLYIKIFGKSVNLPQNIEYYSRLLIPYLTNRSEIVLYLDADIICNKNFRSLFDSDLGENIIAAVQDSTFPIFSSKVNKNGKDSIISNYEGLGFSGDEKYFNSGVMLLNPQKWIDNDVSRKIFEITSQFSSSVFLWDQYALNVFFANSWSALRKEFNETHSIEKSKTFFRHFTKVKPTSYQFCYNDLSEFYHYLDKTPWANWRVNKYLEYIQNLYKKVKSKYSILIK